ncbi:MAG: transglycosylase SLT domain-containing protein [Acidobacteriota bacterium]
MNKAEAVFRAGVVLILATLTIAIIPSGRTFAQNTASIASDPIRSIMDKSELSFRKGEDAFNKGQKEQARQYFDEAVDAIMLSGINLRANPRLDAFYTDLVERIHRYSLPESIRRPIAQPVIAQQPVPNTQPSTNQPGVSVNPNFRQEPAVNIERSAIDDISDVDERELSAITHDGLKIYGKYDFEFTIANPVFQFINFFVSGRGRSTMIAGLQRSGRYRQMVEKVFKEEGVPVDLMWLAQAESVWKPNALSRAAAKGIWQFVPSTGTRFSLMQTAWVDERSHPEKSTRAAARYLRWLHDHFAGDWMLAMAAYNSGENRVDNAIAKCGYADFWELYARNLLPQETRNYVPIILAITIISKNQSRYGFSVKPDPPLNLETTIVTDQTDLRVVADLIGIPYESVQELNPELRKGATPPGQAYQLRLPKGTKGAFEIAYAELTTEQRMRRSVQPATEIARNLETAKPEDVEPKLERSARPERLEKPLENVAKADKAENVKIAKAEKIRVERPTSRVEMKTQVIAYQVKRGDTLASIAGKHGVSVQEVARLNKMSTRGELLRGQTIKIPESIKNSPSAKVKGYEGRYATKNVSKTSARIELKGRNVKSKSINKDAKSGKAKLSKKDLSSKSNKRRR